MAIGGQGRCGIAPPTAASARLSDRANRPSLSGSCLAAVMGKRSGEQARRRFVSTLPALLTSKCVRRCVDGGLLPTTVYRATEPTPEFNSNYFLERERVAPKVRHPAAAKTPPAPAPKPEKLEYRRERIAARVDQLMRLQRGFCYLCGHPFYASRPPTMEHVTPRAMRGRSHRNVLLAHAPCNNAKADRAPRPCELIYLEAVNLRRYRLSYERSP